MPLISAMSADYSIGDQGVKGTIYDRREFSSGRQRHSALRAGRLAAGCASAALLTLMVLGRARANPSQCLARGGGWGVDDPWHRAPGSSGTRHGMACWPTSGPAPGWLGANRDQVAGSSRRSGAGLLRPIGAGASSGRMTSTQHSLTRSSAGMAQMATPLAAGLG